MHIIHLHTLAQFTSALLALGWAASACDGPLAGDAQRTGLGLAPLDLETAALLPAAALAARPPLPHDAVAPAFTRDSDARLSADRSYAIGTTSRGYLVGASPLIPDTEALQLRPVTVARGATWGTQELVAAVARASQAVARRWPGSVLWVGDLSARGGGDLPHHQSHNNGRDVDLAFYGRDAAGRITDGPDFMPVDRSGVAEAGEIRFDVARNWALVETFLRDPTIQTQWIFVADHLRARLLAHAVEAQVDPIVLRRARDVLKQPADSADHRDHFHVRIRCALEERMEGCVDTGPVPSWVDTFDEALLERIREVLPFLRGEAPDEIAYAILRLVRLKATSAIAHIEPLRDHPSERIQRLARDACAFLRGDRTPPSWSYLTGDEQGE